MLLCGVFDNAIHPGNQAQRYFRESLDKDLVYLGRELPGSLAHDLGGEAVLLFVDVIDEFGARSIGREKGEHIFREISGNHHGAIVLARPRSLYGAFLVGKDPIKMVVFPERG